MVPGTLGKHGFLGQSPNLKNKNKFDGGTKNSEECKPNPVQPLECDLLFR